MWQGAVKRLCNRSKSCHVRKVARLLAQALRRATKQKYGDLQEFCKLQKSPAMYRTVFTQQRSLVRSQHRSLPKYSGLQEKRGRQEQVQDTPRSHCAATGQQRG